MSDRQRDAQESATLSPTQWRLVDDAASRFERAIHEGQAPRIADFLEGVAGSLRHSLLLELIRIDWKLRGKGRRLESYLADWSELALDPFALECLLGFECENRRNENDEPALGELQARFPNVSRERLLQMSSGGAAAGAGTPAKIGPYVIKKKLGSGGFGIVYLGYDEQLNRPLAIKVPGPRLLATAAARQSFLREARAAANLRHDAIVRVILVGGEQDSDCFIAYEFIDGIDLHARLKQGRLPHDQTAELVATVAEALHHAHQHGVYHRDIKPHNILLDAKGRPYVADFGLAIREDERAAHRGQLAGTVDYMAPEQVRGEGHHVDGRTDLFSLGVVLYEMLCGRQPFVAGPDESLGALIQEHDPRPLRSIDDSIPRDFERICQKALSKRKSERYPTGSELAEDLRLVVATLRNVSSTAALPAARLLPAAGLLTGSPTPTVVPPSSSDELVRIIPKGLRSFDEQDKDFFLELLPGPRDRMGLPETLRFWKSRLERRDAESGAAVTLIYGPSGCGKSSLVKAGLLPRLGSDVRAIYIEATRDDTESRLLRALDRLSSPAASSSRAALTDAPSALPNRIAALRREESQPDAAKVVIILDQFEQWLHAHSLDLERTELVDALRQADDRNVQFVLLVRDDFWLAVSRLFGVLEIPLLEGVNVQCVDLFDFRHARRVLTLFGQAYGCLPGRSKQISTEQDTFLNRAVEGLSQGGRVISVRLSLFADMLKSKPWTPQSLLAVGGTEGVGVTFLEETFSSRTANPDHRAFEKPARAVLAALLPESGTDIKGRLRSRNELLHASDLEHAPKRFDRLLEILDRDLRIITPTEVEGAPGGVSPRTRDSSPAAASSRAAQSTMFYQLSHDYLVPPLREWLTRKRRETWHGRAELLLEERTAQWTRSRERRHLPTPMEFLSIACGVSRRGHSAEQRQLVRAAARYYGTITAAVLIVISGLTGTAWELNGRAQGRRIVQTILRATPDGLAEPIDNHLPAYRRWADPALRVVADDPSAEAGQRLRAHLALLPADNSRVDFLRARLLDVDFDEFKTVRDRLAGHAQELVSGLWRTLHDSKAESSARFRAGLSLATYIGPQTPPSSPAAASSRAADERWTDEDLVFLARQLAAANPDHQRTLRSHLEPIRQRLLDPLEAIFAEEHSSDSQRAAATALADLARDDPARLAKLISVGTPGQFDILWTVVSRPERRVAVIDALTETARTQPGKFEYTAADDKAARLLEAAGLLIVKPDDVKWNEAKRVALGRRRAGAAITLLRLGETDAAFAAFDFDDDPESVTQFNARATSRDLTAVTLIAALERAMELEASSPAARSSRAAAGEHSRRSRARFGLLLALGDVSFDEVPADQHEAIRNMLLDWFRNDPSSAIHGATRWVLRVWGFEKEVAAAERRAVPFDPGREWFIVEVISPAARSSRADATPQDKTRPDFLTFIVFPSGTYRLGSPDWEQDRSNNEQIHTVKLTRSFAISEQEVTVAMWQRFELATGQKYGYSEEHSPTPEHPVNAPQWYWTIEFCRWLGQATGLTEDDQCYDDAARHPKGKDGFPDNWPLRLGRGGFRLPTEAEWEIAGRAGTNSAFGFGSDRTQLPRHGWFTENSGQKTHVGGTLRPNLRGLSDMHGNVFEWCHDWYSESLPIDATDSLGGDKPTKARVSRGGSWVNGGNLTRSADRNWGAPEFRDRTDGFRVVCEIGEKTP